MAIMEVSIVPVGTPTASIGDQLAQAIRRLDAAKARYQITPTGTVVEGEIAHIFGLAREMHEAGFAQGVQRVITTIVIDDRRDKQVGMDDKVRAILHRLGR